MTGIQAHKAMEDLEWFSKTITGDTGYNKLTLGCALNIKNSQKFNIGKADDLFLMFKEKIKKKTQLFSNTRLKLPYNTCWFESENKQKHVLRSGVLAQNMTKNVIAVHVVREYFSDGAKNKSRWLPSPILFMFCVGSNFKDLPQHEQDLLESMVGINMDIDKTKYNVVPLLSSEDYTKEDYKEIIAEDNDELMLLEFTLEVLNCKNINTKTILPNEKINKKRVKRGKLPIYSHKILTIKQTKNNSVALGGGSGDNRVHLCRGHFKEYTEDNPLFGKFIGTYWWQPHARGNKNNGIVTKTYKVAI